MKTACLRIARLSIALGVLARPTLVAADASTGAAFLKVGTGARPLAMAGAYTAGQADADATHYNPASLSLLLRPEVSLTHAEWLEGLDYDVIGVGVPMRYGAVGLEIIRLGSGKQEGRNLAGDKTGDFTAEDLAAGLSYSYSVTELLSVGGTARYLRSRISDTHAQGVSFDGGLSWRVPSQPMRLGAAILNAGQGLRFIDQRDNLPLTLAAGLAWDPIKSWTAALDLREEPHASFTNLSTGLEFRPFASLALRTGYDFPLHGQPGSLASVDRMRGGLGLHLASWRADYTLAPFDELGLTHRLTLSFAWGGHPTTLKNVVLNYPSYEDDVPELIELLEKGESVHLATPPDATPSH